MTETEVKIKIADSKTIQEKILPLGARLEKKRFFEENTLYDFASSALFKKRQALRVRRMNKKVFLTFKGTPRKSRKFKIREEYETEVRNGKQIKKILKSLGLIPVFQYRKYRTAFRKKRLKICLDETEAGNFIEIEGERNEIVRFAKALGISKKEFIKLDYAELIKASREKNSEKL